MSAAAKGTQSSSANRAELLPALKQELVNNSSLSKTVLSSLADKTGIPLNEIYGVSTFYSYLPVAAVGKNIIRVCGCLPCDLKDAQGVIRSIKKELGIEPGQTTADARFSLEQAGCIGACDQAPAMMINDTLYGNLTPARITEILRSFQ
ncbi:MAG: NAD(P)H-dependent oxidoreductase subunit E [Dehalococcoidia bacterium]|jgi:NADH:ubiquinone oxidoreductase subunit E